MPFSPTNVVACRAPSAFSLSPLVAASGLAKHMKLPVIILLLSAGALLAVEAGRPAYYNYNGTGNNLANPLWGSVGYKFVRLQAPAAYGDGVGSMAGASRPSARLISTTLARPFKERSYRNTTEMLTYLGQLFDHDFDLRSGGPLNGQAEEVANIPIPAGDFYYDRSNTGNKTMSFTRSGYVMIDGVREQPNMITSFLDGSVVYGSDDTTASKLRLYVRGRLRTSGTDNLLPQNNATFGFGMANDAGKEAPTKIRAAGDVRANVVPPVTALQTLFMREHNRLAEALYAQYPDWTDEQLFMAARKWNTAYMQSVCYNEYLPRLGIILPPYSAYDATVDPSIDNMFTTVSYRYAHAEVTDIIPRVDDNGVEIPEGHLLLMDVYFHPTKGLEAGIEPILRGLTQRVQGEVQPYFSSAVQHHLFGAPGFGGTDLFARDIQRGRDHGIPDYNTVRASLGLAKVTSWSQVTSDATLQSQLSTLYGATGYNDCDCFVCGLAEDKLPGSHFGPLFNASLYLQYLYTRNGDWFYYENTENGLFTAAQVANISATGLRDIILRNTNIKSLPIDIYQYNGEPYPVVASSSTTKLPTKTLTLNGGKFILVWDFSTRNNEEGMLFTATVQTTGYFGIGITGTATSNMIGADMIVCSVDGTVTATCNDYWSTGKNAPSMDASKGGTNDVVTISGSQSNGVTTVTFWRPLLASDAYDRTILTNGENNYLLFAYNTQTDSLSYHGANRGQATVAFTSEGSTVVEDSNEEVNWTKTHGYLMAIAFALLFPFGGVCAHGIHLQFVSKTWRGRLYWMHICFQVTAAVVATAGFFYILSKLGANEYPNIMYGHGYIGIIVISLMYAQIVTGVIRPHTSTTPLRRFWEFVHHLQGRSVIYLGIINMFIGIYLLQQVQGVKINAWLGLCIASVATSMLAAQVMTRADKQYCMKHYENGNGHGSSEPIVKPSESNKVVPAVWN